MKETREFVVPVPQWPKLAELVCKLLTSHCHESYHCSRYYLEFHVCHQHADTMQYDTRCLPMASQSYPQTLSVPGHRQALRTKHRVQSVLHPRTTPVLWHLFKCSCTRCRQLCNCLLVPTFHECPQGYQPILSHHIDCP